MNDANPKTTEDPTRPVQPVVRLDFAKLRAANVTRCEEVFHPLEEWAPTDWACALAGEAGEACNAVKKLKRGDGSLEAVAAELADTVIYADLLAARLGLNLGEEVRAKFNVVSERTGSTVIL